MKTFILAALVFPTLAFADWAFVPGANSIEGVNISKSATVAYPVLKEPITLTTVGAGLRNKPVGPFSVKVYVLQLLLNDAGQFAKSEAGALTSLQNETSVGLRLSFVRDVDSATVLTSFQEGFDANKVSPTDPDVTNFIKNAKTIGDAKSGASFNFFFTKNSDGSEQIVLENTASPAGTPANSAQYGAGTINKVLSIWLGTPADSGLKKLKTALVSGVN